MPNWFRKILVVLITVCTLGMVAPPSFLLVTDENKHESKDAVDQNQKSESEELEKRLSSIDQVKVSPYLTTTEFVTYAYEQAEFQSLEKFGPRIKEKVSDEYRRDVLPKLEEVIDMITATLNENDVKYLVISDKPADGTKEKIFHIYDGRTGQDIFRYHVRRERPPQEGYWFSFHYHLADDNFKTHNEIGRIYWDKNTPPNWMA